MSDGLVAQTLVLDWQDGPLEGFSLFAQPRTCVHFRAIAIRANPDDQDEYLHELRGVPADVIDRFISIAGGALGQPRTPVWVPIWPVGGGIVGRALDEFLASVMKQVGPVEGYATSVNGDRFSRWWVPR